MRTNRDVPTNVIKEQMLEMVRKNFISDGEVVPVAIIVYPDGEGEVIATEFRDDKSKIAFVDFLRKRCVTRKPIALMFVSEADMLIIKNEEDEKFVNNHRVGEHKDSIDVIVCSFETRLTSEVIIMEVKSVGGLNMIVREERKGKSVDGFFKDILATPIGLN